MNNIYVDELPESCIDCPCHNGEHGHCKLNGKYVIIYRLFECPLKSLSDRLAEERKKVVQMIKAEFEPSPDSTVITGTPTPEAELVNRGFKACKNRFYKILDKVEKGSNE